tara:strand:+ start:7171 stop:7866 length:696 start_codon:yes stop_codon:yes gene_type:complete
LIKDYSQLEQTSFRTFLAFSLLILVFLIPSLFIFSQSYRVKDIEVQGSLTINEYHFSQFYDTSIWAIGESSFENIYTLDKTIEKIELTKELPNKLSITISHYLQVAKITDLRGSVPMEKVLYKNLLYKITELNNEVINVTIVNGPVDEGFNGELVTLAMTLKNFKIDISKITLTLNGESLTGEYEGIFIDFLKPSDLATKGSAIGELLEKSNCTGEVTFVSKESFITSCKI